MISFKSIAQQILKQAGKPLHTNTITKLAIGQGLLETSGKTPERTMGAQLAVDIKRKGELSDFVRVKPNTFAINEKKEEITKNADQDRVLEELQREEEQEIEGGYVGSAGENAVLSELLFRGYNAARMSVDTGIDIVAVKNSGVFNIQVKTRNISKRHDAFYFNLRILSYERHNTGRTFYIFVLRENNKLDYLILPQSKIDESIDREFIHTVGKGKLYRITIKQRNKKTYIGRKENDVTYFINRWEIIK